VAVDLLYPRPPLGTITPSQREQFGRDGYLLFPGVLPQEEVDRIAGAVDRLYERDVLRSANPDPKRRMDALGVLHEDQVFIDLIDHPSMFGVVLDILGPYIQFGLATATVHPPNPVFTGFLHVDGGPHLQRIRVSETSWPLQVKVLWFLTDVSAPDMGNIVFVPGSHLRPFPERAGRIPDPHMPGAVPLLGKAGDAYVFPHAIWHGPSPNRSGKARKTILYNYCQMFMRAYDFGTPYASLFGRCTPRQRRLLGDLGHEFRPGDFFYAPEDQEALMTGAA
jgi:hypothetical protein